MKDRNKGILLMLLCSLLWSTAGVMFKYIPWHPLVIAGLRALVAGVLVLIYVLATRRRILVNRHTLLGGTAMAATCVLFVFGNKLTTAANAIVLQFTAPVFLLLYSALFLHKRFGRRDVVAVAFTLGGIALFFFDQLSAGQLLGNALSVLAGATMGLMYICIDEGSLEERFSCILIAESLSFLVSVPALILDPPTLAPLPVALILLLGLFQLGLPYLLYAHAASVCPALVCSLLAAVEPLLNPVWVLLFTGERPGVFALIGGAVVIVTITFWCLSGSGKKEPEAT